MQVGLAGNLTIIVQKGYLSKLHIYFALHIEHCLGSRAVAVTSSRPHLLLALS